MIEIKYIKNLTKFQAENIASFSESFTSYKTQVEQLIRQSEWVVIAVHCLNICKCFD
jgi:hypothetical protein